MKSKIETRAIIFHFNIKKPWISSYLQDNNNNKTLKPLNKIEIRIFFAFRFMDGNKISANTRIK